VKIPSEYFIFIGPYITLLLLLCLLRLGAIRPSGSNFDQNWKPGTGEIPLLSLRLGAIRPSGSNFDQNWKPGTGEIPLLSLRLGAIEAQWFQLRPVLEAIPLLSLWLGAIEAQWFQLRPELEAWEYGIKIPLFPNDLALPFRSMNHGHSAFDKPVELHW
jgi:hypothetical protein